MTKTMLIDAANAEEVRVCVLSNGKVEDFDFESAARKPLRGNIYLARVTRVEPSLQAAFVEFGGNRHGFLAFNEIHADYYQIPVSDRRLIQEAEAEEAALASALNISASDDDDDGLEELEPGDGPALAAADDTVVESEPQIAAESDVASPDDHAPFAPAADGDEDAVVVEGAADEVQSDDAIFEIGGDASGVGAETAAVEDEDEDGDEDEDEEDDDDAAPKNDALAKLPRGELIERYKDARRKRARLLRNYKIQEVIKRRQILLVQAVKEERGNKGAALTTYLSLAGRYCVLMPNTARGGGISRKIPLAADRKRLKRVVDSLDVPSGMGLIIRTAGAKRTKAEIKRDYDYLARLWENIRTLTLKSIAPCLIYEEASLIKRAIRDLYDKDIGSILVEGDAGYREAKDFMKMLMPSHSRHVHAYKEQTPLFLKYGVEPQLDAMYRPTVRLKSGGYIVINQTEALIAIDVNSGKSTRERNIEQTALRTNLEAADEAARQFRLRDLAGLIVIDFIDMDEARNNRTVEKRLKDALRTDRARIQLGRISGFGLLELSRQRRRTGIVDGTTHMCPTCGGAGAVRSHETAALRILRSAENEAITSNAGNLQIKCALDVALYILNHKRDWLRRIESGYGVRIELTADPAKAGDNFEIEKAGVRSELAEAPTVVRADTMEAVDFAPEEPADDAAEPADPEQPERLDESRPGQRRRRRRRRGRRDGFAPEAERAADVDAAADGEDESPQPSLGTFDQPLSDDERPRKRRRRGRRGGRRGRRGEPGAAEEPQARIAAEAAADFDQPSLIDEGERIEDSPPAPGGAASEPETISTQIERAMTFDPAAEPIRADVDHSRTQPVEEAPIEAPKPARKGWWNRALGG